MSERPDSPGVWFPPPLLYLAAVVGGLLLNRSWPLPIGGAAAVKVLGCVLLVVWAALTVSAVGLFRRLRTSLVPIRPATSLVKAGVYRFTRNPMYVGLAVLTVALALFLDSWWPAVLLVPVLTLVQRFIILPEERYLQRRFDEEYDAYTRHVRRWL